MKKTNHASKAHRSFRRSVRKLFSSPVKRKGMDDKTIIRLVREIEQSIEVMAREIALQSKKDR